MSHYDFCHYKAEFFTRRRRLPERHASTDTGREGSENNDVQIVLICQTTYFTLRESRHHRELQFHKSEQLFMTLKTLFNYVKRQRSTPDETEF